MNFHLTLLLLIFDQSLIHSYSAIKKVAQDSLAICSHLDSWYNKTCLSLPISVDSLITILFLSYFSDYCWMSYNQRSCEYSFQTFYHLKLKPRGHGSTISCLHVLMGRNRNRSCFERSSCLFFHCYGMSSDVTCH